MGYKQTVATAKARQLKLKAVTGGGITGRSLPSLNGARTSAKALLLLTFGLLLGVARAQAATQPESADGAQKGAGASAHMLPADCVQRMVEWFSRGSDGAHATLLAGIATLGLVITTGTVACGLAAWLCGVGWRAARGPGAQPTSQCTTGREDNRTLAGCSRTRNPQHKSGGGGETDITRQRADPTLSEPPTLDGAYRYGPSDGNGGGGGPVLAHRVDRVAGPDDTLSKSLDVSSLTLDTAHH